MKFECDKVLLLNPDNFTPLSRTPWAGAQLTQKLKKNVSPQEPNNRVGESWDVSIDSDFPSRVINLSGMPFLKAVIEQNYNSMICSTPEKENMPNGGGFELLVKTMSTAQALSLQIHPEDSDPNLLPDECGKPESWYIIDCEQDSGIYLGLSQYISSEELRRLLTQQQDIRPFLNFVPVKPGDYFEIIPRTLHAIGPGIMLLEPQRVLPQKKGKTFRLFDWGRHYSPDGELAKEGAPRPLHIDASLSLIDFKNHVGPEYVKSLRRHAKATTLTTDNSQLQLKWQMFPKNDFYQLHILDVSSRAENTAKFTVNVGLGFAVGIVLAGSMKSYGRHSQSESIEQGTPFFLPHQGQNFYFSLNEPCLRAKIAFITPAWSSIVIQSI